MPSCAPLLALAALLPVQTGSSTTGFVSVDWEHHGATRGPAPAGGFSGGLATSPRGHVVYAASVVTTSTPVQTSIRVQALDALVRWQQGVPLLAQEFVLGLPVACSADGARLLIATQFPDAWTVGEDDLMAVCLDAQDGQVRWQSLYDSGGDDELRGWASTYDGAAVAWTAAVEYGGAPETVLVTKGHDVLTGAEILSHTVDPATTGQSEFPTWIAASEGQRRFYLAGSLAVPGANLEAAVFALQLPTAYASTTSLSLSSGGSAVFHLHAGPLYAGDVYVLAGSFAGTQPGVQLGAVSVPLQPDPYCFLTLAGAGSALLPSSVGFVGADGNASSPLVVPAGSNPALAGYQVHHAFAVLSTATGAFVHASNAVPLLLFP